MSIIEKSVNMLARWLNWMAAGAIVVIMVVVCVNVLSRSLFAMPLKGTVDIVSQMGVFVIGGAIAYTQILKSHIRITLFIDKLPKPVRAFMAALIDTIGIILFGIISWQSILFAKGTYEIGELSEVLKIPIAPFAAVVSAGCIVLTLVLVTDLITILAPGRSR